jgi:hypothetical protein
MFPPYLNCAVIGFPGLSKRDTSHAITTTEYLQQTDDSSIVYGTIGGTLVEQTDEKGDEKFVDSGSSEGGDSANWLLIIILVIIVICIVVGAGYAIKHKSNTGDNFAS